MILKIKAKDLIIGDIIWPQLSSPDLRRVILVYKTKEFTNLNAVITADGIDRHWPVDSIIDIEREVCERKLYESLNWSTLLNLRKAAVNASVLANDIDEVCSNIDMFWIDNALNKKFGFGLKQIRLACDELFKIYDNEHNLKVEFEFSLENNGKINIDRRT